MKDIRPLAAQHYLELLQMKGSGVTCDLVKTAATEEHFASFSARLECDDVHRLYLWFEFRKYTGNDYSKLTEVGESADQSDRVRRFAEGDPAEGRPAVDLRTSSGLEPMLVAEGLHCGPLYALDGNHRLIAQHRSGKGLGGVPVFVLTHPRMMEWAYAGDVRRHWFDRVRES